MIKRLLPFIMAAQVWADSGSARQVYVKHKAIHALVGITVAFTFHELDLPKTGLVLVLGLGIAKELYDASHGGRFRAGDVAWTVLPATALVVGLRW